MLTRVEIDGFKSFERFELSLPPFAVIVGPNASGKSNFFDALRLLARLAVLDVRSAMRDMRGEPSELFRRLPDESAADRMRLAVETLLEPEVEDDYGQKLSLSCTRIRYEITVGRRTVDGIDRFFVEEERAIPIRKVDDHWSPLGKKPSSSFRKRFVKYNNRKPFLQTEAQDRQRDFLLHQDGRQGRLRRLSAVQAERSVLSTVTLATEFPHLYALRKELHGLKYLQLDPVAERRSAPLDAPDVLQEDGANLAAVLYRIKQQTASPTRPEGALADMLADLSQIVPGITDLHVERDDERREYRLRLGMRDGQQFSSRVVSDGTLRVLALLALLHDPQHRGILCFEEPENGVHKSRLEMLMSFLEESCADPGNDEVEEASLLQIIVNTHSPVAARASKKAVILAEMAEIVGAGATHPRRATRMTPYLLSEQAELPLEDQKVLRASRLAIDRLLAETEQRSLAA